MHAHELAVPGSTSDIAAGDFNADGRVDLALPSGAAGALVVLLGNGDGSFRPLIQSLHTTSTVRGIAVDDFDRDGRDDFGTLTYQASSGAGTVTVFLSLDPADFDEDGIPGTGQDIQAFFACLAGRCCTACGSADFDGDGDSGTDLDIETFFRALSGAGC